MAVEIELKCFERNFDESEFKSERWMPRPMGKDDLKALSKMVLELFLFFVSYKEKEIKPKRNKKKIMEGFKFSFYNY